ncbi:spore coat protein [Clostridium oceanicum]|uniref:Spore coat protein n=1 Tax=Clostridium oceanicum TaxID=1543 RepID=A0ABN1JGD6_9CLOT
MTIQLTEKERMFLEDAKINEEVCIQKYQNYSNQVKDPKLQQILSKLAGEEQEHYDTLDTLLKGEDPKINVPKPQKPNQNKQVTIENNIQGVMSNKKDEVICNDLLSTEKYVAGTYGDDVFESFNPIVREAMQHIQKDEQKHGEEIFNYMYSKNMCNVK